MDNNRAKTISCRKPFCYNDIINYIKNHNKNITKTKTKTRTIYQKIIQEGSKRHTTAEETQWKKQIPHINFENIWKNTFESYGQSFVESKTFITDYCIIQRK